MNCKACIAACGSDSIEEVAASYNNNNNNNNSSSTFHFSHIYQTAPEAERAALSFKPKGWTKIEGDFADTLEIPLPGGKSRKIVNIKKGALSILAHKCIVEVQHFFRRDRLEAWAKIVEDPEASDNDRFVAKQLLTNACIASGQILPSCQDTGTAIVFAKKGESVWTEEDDDDTRGRRRGRSPGADDGRAVPVATAWHTVVRIHR